MARIRSVKPEFWTSAQVVECSPIARLLFIGIWNFCDDNGIHPDSVKRLKMEIFPADPVSDADIKGMVDELVKVELLEHYVVGNQGFLRVTGWSKHQKIEKPTFKHPLPEPRKIGDASESDRRTVAEQSPSALPRNGMERNGKDINTPIPPEGHIRGKSSKAKSTRVKPGETMQAFLDRCKAEGIKPIPQDDPIFTYIDDVGLSNEMLALCWFSFKNRYLGTDQKQKDWRAHYRNAVKRNWYKLWFIGNDGTVSLTTAGQQAQREMDAIKMRGAA